MPVILRLLRSVSGVTVHVNVDRILFIEIVRPDANQANPAHGDRIARLRFSDDLSIDVEGNPEKVIAFLESGKW